VFDREDSGCTAHLLAYEIIPLGVGQASVIARLPAFVAFSFGLLHGFGFTSARTDIDPARCALALVVLVARWVWDAI
jgi:hypothetical protein